MAQVIIEDLDPGVLEKLEARALENGRSLQAELKHILETAASAPRRIADDMEITIKRAEKMREQIAIHAGLDITKLKPIDREKALMALAKLKALKKLSLGGMSIREMREEGRRF